MFGFNCGVLISYEEASHLFWQGVTVHSPPTERAIDIISSSGHYTDEESDYNAYSSQTPVEDMWHENVCLEETPHITEVISGNQATAAQLEYDRTISEMEAPVSNSVSVAFQRTAEFGGTETAVQKPIIQPIEENIVTTEQIEENPVTTVTAVTKNLREPPDISGMTLKGWVQSIAEWTGGVRTSEEILVTAFGKPVIQKLISEGYLIRTRKGISLGS